MNSQRRTLTLLIRIEIAEGAGLAHSNDSELARTFATNSSCVDQGGKNASIGLSTKSCLGHLMSEMLRQTFNFAPCRLPSVRAQSMVPPAALKS